MQSAVRLESKTARSDERAANFSTIYGLADSPSIIF
jgi:hypothetical protein